jgi:hypothetical protein
MFRPEALRRYLGRNDQTILLKLTSPKKFAVLWLLLGLLIMCLLLAWVTRIPAYAGGVVTVVNAAQGQQGQQAGAPGFELLVLSAPENLGQLRVGQKVFFKLGESTQVAEARVSRVEPRVVGRQEVADRFALDSDTTRKVRYTSAVAFASMENVPADVAAASDPSRFYEARIETGSRAIIDLIPGIAKLHNK